MMRKERLPGTDGDQLMTEQFILQFAPLRLKQQGYNKYHFRHRDFIVEAGKNSNHPCLQ
jgi:hypothetical protein